MARTDTFAIASYCSSHAWGGLEMNVLRFLKWMRARNWAVVLYARPDTPLFVRADAFDVPVRSLLSHSKATDLLRARALAKMTVEDNVRVLVMHQSHDLLLSALTKVYRSKQLRLIYQQHMHVAGDKRDLLHAWQYRRLDAFVSLTPSLAKHVRERTVIPPERIHVIPLGIELDPLLNKPSREEARRQLELPADGTIIGVIGRLDPKKGQHVAIKALRRIHDTGYQSHLLIVGAATMNEHADYTAYLHRLVDELRLTPFVHFRPHLEQPALAYAAMDIFVLTSQSETYGMVTIEAFASALPVIGSDSGGTVDLIDHEGNGLRFPPDDDGVLADAVMRLLCDSALASRLAAQGRCDAVGKYSHVRQCERWEDLMGSLT